MEIYGKFIFVQLQLVKIYISHFPRSWSVK